MRRSSGALLCLLALVAVSLTPAAAQAGALDLGRSFLTDRAALTSGPPVSIGLPAIAGTPIRGETLTANSGSWSPSATSVTYQWQRDTGSGFADIAGATSTTYTLTTTDVGAGIRVHVVATNLSGTGTADAATVGPVLAATPVATVAPTASGTLVGGQTLTATRGTWYPAGTSYTYQWQRDTGSGFANIAGATTSTYTTLPADVGASLRARVTATNSYASTTATTNALGLITTGKPVSTVAPTVNGTAKRGRTLAATAGTWNPTATTFAFQWERDEGSGFADIVGATGTTYTPGADDLGFPLRVTVSATNAFGTTTATTAATANVATDPPVNSGTPGIAGSPKRTFTLTASAGTWSPAGATFTYKWQRDSGSGFADITGATSTSYTLAAADVGKVVRVQVTATNVDGNATASSAQTATIAAATPGNSSAPIVTGAARVGEVLTTTDGTWTPAAASYAYQWQRRVAGAFVDISGATAKTYTLVTADAGTVVRSVVTATNSDGTGDGYSAATATVVAPPVAPSTIAAPAGTLEDTQMLTIDGGTWTPSTTTLTYQWLRCPAGATTIGSCATIGTGKTYTLVGPDVGRTIAVRVTGAVPGASTVVTSTLTANVAGRALTLTTAPTISGTVQVVQKLHAVPAVWSVPTLTEKYQWRRCDTDGVSNCADIPGATNQDYKVTVADAGRALIVREAATSWGRSATANSVAKTVADQPLPVKATAPVLTGNPVRTQNLQVTRGTWANDPTSFTYQWQRCDANGASCAAIAGATRANYVLTATDVAHTIVATVTAGNTEGTTTAASAPTSVIAAVLPELVFASPVSGRLQVPQMVQVVRAAWRSTPDTRYTFQWQRCDANGASCADIVGARNQYYRLQAIDARMRLRVIHTATNPDGTTAGPTPVTAPVLPALPGMTTAPRLTGVGRADVGKTVTLTPGSWSAATEITTKVLQFWRCNPRCTALSTGGASSYVLTNADAGGLIRGSETATGPGGTLVAWASAWLGPVHSATVASSSFAARGGTAMLRTSSGVALASATVGSSMASASASVARAAVAPAATRTRTVRISLRRAARAPKGPLRAWACLAKPSSDDKTAPCTKAVTLRTRRRATLKLKVAKGAAVRVVVVRKR